MKKCMVALVIAAGMVSAAHADEFKVGVVNFQTCMMESNYGKKEQEQLESVKNQMESLMKDLDKKLTSLNEKMQDSDYLDTLSPEGEQELKGEFMASQEEMQRYQNQYYQVMQQAQMRLSQVMASRVSDAASKVAEEKNLSQVVHKDVFFFSNPSLDVTEQVISQLDITFGEEEQAHDQESATEKSE